MAQLLLTSSPVAHDMRLLEETDYLKLLSLAGCEYDDLERLVVADGVETARRRLFRAGVYLTTHELKGRTPAVRSGRAVSVTPALRLAGKLSGRQLPMPVFAALDTIAAAGGQALPDCGSAEAGGWLLRLARSRGARLWPRLPARYYLSCGRLLYWWSKTCCRPSRTRAERTATSLLIAHICQLSYTSLHGEVRV